MLNKVLSIRILGKKRKDRIKDLLFDLTHFKNLWIIFIKKYKELYNIYPTDISILYALISDKNYSPKSPDKLTKFNEIYNNILVNKELNDFINKLKQQKEKIANNYLVQQIIRVVTKSFNDYRKAYKKYLKHPEKFNAPPKPPKAKKLKFIFYSSVEINTNTFIQQKDKILIRLRMSNKKYLKVKLPNNFVFPVKSIRLKISGNDIYADVVYKTEEVLNKAKGKYIAGIDLGLNNLISLVSNNPDMKSLIISGKELKTFNQWYNKEKAKIQSNIDNIKNNLTKVKDEIEREYLNKLLSEQLAKFRELSAFRKRKIDNDFHKISRKIIDLLYQTGHKTIYIGKNVTESKNGVNLGKKNNQNFVSIPFKRLIDMIKYKAEEYGIEIIEIDEAYTSKTSPFVNIFEVRKLGEEYLKQKNNKEISSLLNKKINSLTKTKRKKRGILEVVLDESKKIFNADLVGAYNIARVGIKSLRLIENLKTLFVKLCNPVRLKLKELFYQVTPESLWIGSSKATMHGLNLNDYKICNNFNTF